MGTVFSFVLGHDPNQSEKGYSSKGGVLPDARRGASCPDGRLESECGREHHTIL